MHFIFARSFSHFKHSLSMIQQCLSFKSTSLWDICPFPLSTCLCRGPAGKHVWQWDGKKQRGKSHVSCIVSTFKAFTGKEGERETKRRIWVCLEKSCISRRGEEEPAAAPLVLHTSADFITLSLHARAPGEHHSHTKQRDQYVGRKPPSNLLIH